MACNNCYNGCVETISDKCVSYTGLDVAALSIENGDSLFVIEQALIDAVVSFLNGTGIKITISPSAYCALVVGYLPVSPTVTTPTSVQLFEALVKAACSLQTQVTAIDATLTTLNADYTIGCLTGVTASSDTHAIVQAVITKLCSLGVDLAALALDVSTNYVKISNINSYIAAYLASIAPSTNNYTKMVPYIAYEYHGSLTGFDTGSGIGSGVWTKVYLCNGLNGTPDKRGRVAVGAIINAGDSNPLNASVDPAVNPIYNPNYAVGQILGSNSVTLLTTQIPAHTHFASVADTHYHYVASSDSTNVTSTVGANDFTARQGTYGTNEEYALRPSAITANVGKSSVKQGTIEVTNANTGGSAAHDNKQPVIAAYYIMYIP